MSGRSGNPTTKERLTCIETKQDSIISKLDNHLRHHWEFTLVLLGAIITEAAGIIIIAIKLIK